MFSRLKTNIAQYPRLFKLWLTLVVLLAAENYVPRLVNIQNYGFAIGFALAVIALLIYRWIVTDAGRRRILQDILSRFEGREVCTVAEHFEPTETEEEEWHT